MSLLLRKLLSRFLTLGVGENDDSGDAAGADISSDAGADPGTGDDAAQAAAGAGEDDAFEDLIDLEDPPEPRHDPKAAAAAATARAERAERALADTLAERRGPAAPQPGVDPELARDEQLLEQARRAPGATAESVAWAQWQINSNRMLREGRRDSQQALAEAREIADKTAFDRLELTKPKLHKAYAGRVETMIADLRSKGQAVPPRAALLRFFIGDDMVNGKVRPKAAKAAAGEAPAGRVVDRGRTPPARSDVRARGPQSEYAKRRARLENQLI